MKIAASLVATLAVLLGVAPATASAAPPQVTQTRPLDWPCRAGPPYTWLPYSHIWHPTYYCPYWWTHGLPPPPDWVWDGP